MSFYFLNESIRHPGSRTNLHEVFDAPIKIDRGTWEHLEDPRRISKVYTFDDRGQQQYFVSELMNAVDFRRHDIRIEIQGDTVLVETRTETIDDVTEIDLEVARTADSVYADSEFVMEVE